MCSVGRSSRDKRREDRKDTDFTVKVLDVYPDGRAYNLDETILRARYREDYEKQVWMEPRKVYKVVLGPMNTSNYFDAGVTELICLIRYILSRPTLPPVVRLQAVRPKEVATPGAPGQSDCGRHLPTKRPPVLCRGASGGLMASQAPVLASEQGWLNLIEPYGNGIERLH